MSSSRLTLIREGIQKCRTATAKATPLKSHSDPAVRELANAIHYLAFGMQEIGLALSDESRVDDLPIQRGK
ncbi:hypothetical protein H7H51_07760 [Mycolicibacterium farcinogenes]|nr:hypothetical protein [Mycolicibacterium farcinogenes]